jgi:molecular chaperone DnaK (HSP70)
MSLNQTVVGIDLGSSKIVVGVLSGNGVDILINQFSYRQTPCVVTYGQQREAGERSALRMKKEFANSIVHPLRFVGHLSQALLRSEENFNFSQTQLVEGGKVFFTVKFEQDYTIVTIEQALAALLTEVMSLLRFNGVTPQETVLSVPSHFGQIERIMILDACRIAGLPVTKLLNENTANVLNYSIFRRTEFDNFSPRVVGFFDFGHSKTSIYFASLQLNKMTIVAEATNPSLGCRNLDSNLLHFYAESIRKKHKVSIFKDRKSVVRVLEAVQKQRVMLTINKEAPISLEGLTEDVEFSFQMTRDQFEKINASVFKEVRNLLDKVYKSLSREHYKALHSIERLGGGSRIPAIEHLVATYFSLNALSKTLDASESCAKGCTLQAVLLSPKHAASNFDFKDRLVQPVSLKVQLDKEEVRAETLFETGTDFGTIQSKVFGGDRKLHLSLVCLSKDETEERLLSELALPRLAKGQESSVTFALDHNGIAFISDVQIRDSKTKLKAKTEFGLVEKRALELSSEDVGVFRKKECLVLEKEALVNQLAQARDDFERTVYDCRNALDEQKHEGLIGSSERKAVTQMIVEAEQWLAGGHNRSVDDYTVIRRHFEDSVWFFTRRTKALRVLTDLFNDGNARLSQFEVIRSKHVGFTVESHQRFDSLLGEGQVVLKGLEWIGRGQASAEIDSIDVQSVENHLERILGEMESIVRAIDSQNEVPKIGK